jgi:hypothetical protein
MLAGCSKDAQGYCTDKVVHVDLGEAPTDVLLKVNTALGDVIAIHFPAGVRFLPQGVVLGNTSVFDVEIDAPGARLLVRPRLPKDRAASARDLLNARTNLQVEIERGWRINLDLRQWYPSEAVRRLVFQSRAIDQSEAIIGRRVTEAVAELRAAVDRERAALADSAAALAIANLSDAFLRGARCEEVDRVEMQAGLWLRVDFSCQIGTRAFVRFTVSNRRRDAPFVLQEVRASGAPIAGATIVSAKGPVDHDADVVAVASWAGERPAAFGVRAEDGRAVDLSL